MIELKNIKKTYLLKKGHSIIALHDITLSLPSTGLISIVGRSGSGKSTLLNLLGGIDTQDSGQIIINGTDLGLFTDTDWDNYRQTSVGFVFQDYHLIQELSVYENIALGIRISSQSEEGLYEDIKRILHELDMESYIDNKVNQLSGGQMQRVAIARAIIKKPRILLADEPTGNLDDDNAKVIMSILKSLSKEILVVLVTHDKDMANDFSDQVVKLSSGKIDSISINETKTMKDENPVNLLAREKIVFNKIPRPYIFQLLKMNLLLNKTRVLLTAILFTMSIILSYLVLSIVFFNYPEVSSKTFIANDMTRITFNYNDDCGGFCSSENRLLYQKMTSLQEEYTDYRFFYLLNNAIYFDDFETSISDNSGDFIVSRTINQVALYSESLDIDLLYGSTSNEPNEILITDYVADMLIRNRILSVSTIEEAISKHVSIPVFGSLVDFVIVGILDTDYETYDVPVDDLSQFDISTFYSNLNTIYSMIYFSEDNLQYCFGQSGSFLVYLVDSMNQMYINQVGNFDYLEQKYDNLILYGNNPISNKDIVIPLSLLINLNKIDYTTFDADQTLYLNEWIGQTVNFSEFDESYTPSIDGYIISGVVDDRGFESEDYGNRIILVNNELFKQEMLTYAFSINANGQVEYHSQTSLLPEIISNLMDAGYYHSFVYLNDFYGTILQLRELILVIASFLVIWILGQILLYTSNAVKARQKQIGILRTLGASKSECNQLFSLEIIGTVFISYLVSFPLIWIFNQWMDHYLSSIYDYSFVIFYYSFDKIVLIIIITMLISLGSSILAIKKLTKKNPMNTIRQT
ncbi:MAG: ATP-binding cassette domain-containing protein [Candidatus Izemoplasmatales bacterium]